MANSFNTGVYPQQDIYAQYANSQGLYPQQRKSSGPSTFGMMTLGALGGGAVGYLKNIYPVGKDGKTTDTFAKQAYENIAKIDSKDAKLYEQSKNILKKIDGVKDVEGLKKLLNKNKDFSKVICEGMNTTVDNIVATISPSNLKATKEALKVRIQATNNVMYQLTKNSIERCWDAEGKKFVKPDLMDSKIFDAIKSAKTSGQWKKAFKYGGITAGVMGALTIGYKMFTSKMSP